MTEVTYTTLPLEAFPSLAIVIPAFRAKYLSEALASLSRQTDGNFTVYVGDDASSDDLKAICESFGRSLNIRYHRFPANLGGSDLVAQWTRCIDLSAEDWVWMIGDDDMLEPGCVAAWRAACIGNEKVGLFHFGVTRVDENGSVLVLEPEFPMRLAAREFLQGRLSGQLSSYAPDYLFSRKAFKRVSGFQSFPLAWCSDDATWIKIAADAGIYSIRGPRVRWRLSGTNISSYSRLTSALKASASLSYVRWLAGIIPTLPLTDSSPTNAELRGLTVWWYFRHAENVGFRFWPAHALGVAKTLAGAKLCSFPSALLRCARADLRRGRAK